MTEYDYSPEAIEQHNAKLRSTDRWRSNLRQEEFADPFVPIPGEHQPDIPPQGPALPPTPPTIYRSHDVRTSPPQQPAVYYANPKKKKDKKRSRSQRPPMLQNFSSSTVLPLPHGYATRSYSSPVSGAQQPFVYPPNFQPYPTVPYSNPLRSAPHLTYPSPPVNGRPSYSSSSSYTHPSPPTGPPMHVSGYPAQAPMRQQGTLPAAPAQHYVYQQQLPAYNPSYPTAMYQIPGGGYVVMPAPQGQFVQGQFVQSPPAVAWPTPYGRPPPKSSGSHSFFGSLGFGRKHKMSRRDSF